MELREIALAIAKANRHPNPEEYVDACERAANGEEAYPEPKAEEAKPEGAE